MSEQARTSGPAGEGQDVVVLALTPHDAAVVSTWHYDGPWSVYDGSDAQLISPDLGYRAIAERRTGRFLGFFCLGFDARVQGLGEEPGVLDLGVGLDPAIVGRGSGASIVRPVLEWIEDHCDAVELRAVVQAWNERSLRFCRRLGFEETGHHLAEQGGAAVDYVVLRRPLRAVEV